MPEARTVETVRREIELEREELGRALDRLRTETTSVKRQLARRARFAVALGVLLVGIAAVVRALLARVSD